MSLLEVSNVTVHFRTGSRLWNNHRVLRAVDNVNIYIEEGETLGLVGESGCGKTTLGKALVRLVTLSSGKIVLDGEEISQMQREEFRQRRQKIQMVFQDPFASLNPRTRVGESIGEALDAHKLAEDKRSRTQRINELLMAVGLSKDYAERLPHELSGGQRQRVGIARALAVKPRLLICDEPVNSLDVSMQGQIVNLLMDLQEQFRIAYLFIAHDLSLVPRISHRIAVMYEGRIIEQGPCEKIVSDPQIPYTRSLFAASPILKR